MKEDRYAIVLPVGGEPILLHCNDDGTLDLETMQDIVGGYIETTSTIFRKREGSVVMIVNEEGKLQGLEPNRAATDCANYEDVICGNAIIMQAVGEELVGFTKAVAETLAEAI